MTDSTDTKSNQDWPPVEDWPPAPVDLYRDKFGAKHIPPDWSPPVEVKPTLLNGLEWQIASNIEPESIKWLWPNRIPRGKVSIVGGFPNHGKSQILCNLAAIITTGGDWPNGEGKCDKGAVIILAAEDTAKDTLVPRLMAAGADMDQVAILGPLVSFKEGTKVISRVFNIDEDLKRLDAMIRYEEKINGRKVKAVLLDPLNAYYGGGKNFDVHKSADMRAMLTPLSKWCGDKDIALIGIAHFNKGSNSHLLYRITDSAAITAVCRAVWFAIKDEDAKKFYFVEGKKNVGRESTGIEYQIDDKEIGRNDSEGVPIVAPFIAWGNKSDRAANEILGGGKAGIKTGMSDAASAFVIKALQFHGKLKRTTLEANAREYGITPRTLRRAIEALNLKPIKEGFPAVVSYSLDVVNLATDDLNEPEDPLLTADHGEPDFG